MSELTGIAATLTTAATENAGTDDHLYIGVVGTGGGREFPLNSKFDDFEIEQVTYKLGAFWEPVPASEVRFPHQSRPGEVNDPAYMPLELELVYAVYVRKQGDNSTEDDDAYRLNDLKVVLYGPTSPLKRTFRLRRRGDGPWLANENGHVIYLAEVVANPGIGEPTDNPR